MGFLRLALRLEQGLEDQPESDSDAARILEAVGPVKDALATIRAGRLVDELQHGVADAAIEDGRDRGQLAAAAGRTPSGYKVAAGDVVRADGRRAGQLSVFVKQIDDVDFGNQHIALAAA